jgi:hypothetical protein
VRWFSNYSLLITNILYDPIKFYFDILAGTTAIHFFADDSDVAGRAVCAES